MMVVLLIAKCLVLSLLYLAGGFILMYFCFSVEISYTDWKRMEQKHQKGLGRIGFLLCQYIFSGIGIEKPIPNLIDLFSRFLFWPPFVALGLVLRPLLYWLKPPSAKYLDASDVSGL
ncbi:MAG: hypothetical protein AAB358_03455 [Patescibacteria group bacterium]